VTFVDRVGEHEVTPMFAVQLKDALGYQHAMLFFAGTECDAASGAALAPGGQLEPTPLCFEAGGASDGPLSVVWLQTGHFTELRLP
jgi:hypothetical protein